MVLLYNGLLLLQFLLIPPVFLYLMYRAAPYGKFSRTGGSRLVISSRMAWMIMELPAFGTILVLYLFSPARKSGSISLIFLLIWEFHYVYRTFLFPLLITGARKNFPLFILLSAWFFNLLNGFVNGYFLFYIHPLQNWNQLRHVPFYAGVILFLTGLFVHVFSDHILRKLRRLKGPGYHIPEGGLYRWVSSPNYLGEWIQWSGWALLTWSLPGLAFSLFTFANLFPRAVLSHKWYKSRFKNYPSDRNAFIPGIL